MAYAETIFEDSIAKAVKLVETNLLDAIKYNYTKEEATGYQILGRFNYSLSNYKLATSNFQKAIPLVKRQKNRNWLFLIMMLILGLSLIFKNMQ
mgnify:CR=1 FL=1